MTEKASDNQGVAPLPSVDDSRPTDEGGPIARSGFNYQDEIAVSFLIEMLETSSVLKVHCETHDDVLVVRAIGGSTARIAEFVQVKGGAPDKLWSVADLCAREGGKAGTSLFETSLARDKHFEESRFRLVTFRPVVIELKMLTFQVGAPGREPEGAPFKNLESELDRRFPTTKSVKKNGTTYWIGNCFWDERHSEEAVRTSNLLRLIQLGSKEGRPLLPEHAELLLENLRVRAKSAGDAKWETHRDQKIITRLVLREWWDHATAELLDGVTASGGRLRGKMTEAGLPDELVRLAVEMRLDYAAAARTSQYMEGEERERLQRRVKSEMMSLRSKFAAGEINLDGAGFHALCLSRLDAVNAERQASDEDRSAFLKGCMYDIADRCLLRFSRPSR